jgi:hypothetical protein
MRRWSRWWLVPALTVPLLLAPLFVGGDAGLAAGRRIMPVFLPTRDTLHYTTLPVLLPTVFAEAHLNDPHRTFVRASAEEHYYRVQIDDADICNGANACSEGSFSASDGFYRATHTKAQSVEDMLFSGGRRVKLAAGLSGYYSEAPSGASAGGNSYLYFFRGEVRYGLITRINTQTELVRIANSAIQNGVIPRDALRGPPAGER